ncbi:MAG: DNA alkylation repair protein [Alphaproteobacteria bacterium]|nr:DNA alkylation repair protein [Alphaproteobacteria bacterium]
MLTDEIQKNLFLFQDIKYRDFQSKLLPTVDPASLIGVRTPELRKYAGRLIKTGDYADFIKVLPHRYFDENQLHAFIVSGIKDYTCCIKEVCRFLHYVDNWATCDQMSPKVFKKHKKELLLYVKAWIKSSETYAVRFGIKMLMEHFLDEDFDASFPETVAEIRSEEYYVRMMIAWYFATALAKQYDVILPFVENKKLDVWTHNKAIQKAVESYRITAEQKEYLKTLKIRGNNGVK